MATNSGLSTNAVSLIERGENSPTVTSLHLLATALGCPMVDFFQENDRATAVHVRSNKRLLYQNTEITMESLGIGLRDQHLQPFLITIKPSAAADRAITHPGQEFVYCLEGTATYDVDGQTYSLLPGDSLLLDARRPHCFRNPGNDRTVLLVVFQAVEHLGLAMERHLNR